MYSNIILIMIHMFLYLTKLITHSAHLECASLYIAHLANMPIFLSTLVLTCLQPYIVHRRN